MQTDHGYRLDSITDNNWFYLNPVSDRVREAKMLTRLAEIETVKVLSESGNPDGTRGARKTGYPVHRWRMVSV